MKPTASKQLPNPRTVPVNGEKVIALRKAKSWTVSDLAYRSFTNERTIRSIETGNECLPFIVKKLANAFGLKDPSELLSKIDNNIDVMNNASASHNKVIVISLDEKFHNYDQVNQLGNALQSMLKASGIRGEVKVLEVRDENGIEIDLGIDMADCMSLFISFYKSKLRKYRVKRVWFPSGFAYGNDRTYRNQAIEAAGGFKAVLFFAILEQITSLPSRMLYSLVKLAKKV